MRCHPLLPHGHIRRGKQGVWQVLKSCDGRHGCSRGSGSQRRSGFVPALEVWVSTAGPVPGLCLLTVPHTDPLHLTTLHFFTHTFSPSLVWVSFMHFHCKKCNCTFSSLRNLLSLKYKKKLFSRNYIKISVVKRLIAINRIQNKSFCLHNICVYTVYIYYVYINTNTCMYIFKKNMLCLYIKYS